MIEFLITIVWSILPISELRGGIIYAILTAEINPYVAYFLAVISNILIIFPIFFFLDNFHKIFLKFKPYKFVMDWKIARINNKRAMIEKWQSVALLFLVAIPLPFTGVYTASIASWFFNMDRKKSIIAMIPGVFIAGLLVLAGLGVIKLFF